MDSGKGNEYDKRGYVLLIALSVLIMSCGSHGGNGIRKLISPVSYDKEFSEQLKSLFENADTSSKPAKGISADVRYVYRLNGYKPLWLSGSGSNKSVQKFIDELNDIQWDGINPERYNLSGLKKLQAGINGKSDANAYIAFDTAFTRSYLTAAHDLLMGEILPKVADTLWFHQNDSVWTAPAMLTNNDIHYTPLSEYRSEIPTYNLLRDEYKRYYGLENDTQLKAAIAQLQGVRFADDIVVKAANVIINAEIPWVKTDLSDTVKEQTQLLKAYQDYVDIRATGKPDSITLRHLAMQPAQIMDVLRANMERVRWMQKKLSDLYILVDVPLMELYFVRDGQLVMHMRTIVGKPSRQTPSFTANMTNIIVNPPWGVPPTILKKDVLPGINKSGKRYLAKKGLKAYDHKGNVINASRINAGNYKRYVYKQAPGDDNALGFIKFNLPNPWDIYLHDTPHRSLFANRKRDLSSGCVRVQQPQQMALYILGDIEKMRFDQGRLDSMIKTHKTRWERMPVKIPVHLVYLTALEDTTGKHIRLVSDIYNRDEKLISLLK